LHCLSSFARFLIDTEETFLTEIRPVAKWGNQRIPDPLPIKTKNNDWNDALPGGGIAFFAKRKSVNFCIAEGSDV
jgi:hypothetical protein